MNRTSMTPSNDGTLRHGSCSRFVRRLATRKKPDGTPRGPGSRTVTSTRTCGFSFAPLSNRLEYSDACAPSATATEAWPTVSIAFATSHPTFLEGNEPLIRSVVLGSAPTAVARLSVRVPNTTEDGTGKGCGRTLSRSHGTVNVTAAGSDRAP